MAKTGLLIRNIGESTRRSEYADGPSEDAISAQHSRTVPLDLLYYDYSHAIVTMDLGREGWAYEIDAGRQI